MNLMCYSLFAALATLESYISETLVIFTFVLFAVRSLIPKIPKKNPCPYPPGPPISRFNPLGYILGHISELGVYHLKFTELAETYGPVYQLFLGPKRTIVISDYKIVREAFKQPVFSGRPNTELTKLLDGYGVINATGPRWREQRAFLHNVLRDFGARNFCDANNHLVTNIKAEVYGFCNYLQSTACQSVYIRVPMARGIANIIGIMLMSTDYADGEEDFVNLLNCIDEGFELLLGGTMTNIYPVMKFVPYYNTPYWRIKRNFIETSKYFEKIAQHHKETLDENNVRDIVDAFLVQQKKYDRENKEHYFTDRQLCQVMADIFSAGLETVTSTLEWAIAFLVRNPDVQQKVYEEIERVVGTERSPEFADLKNMPYFEATILEVQRRGNVIALGNTHATLEDTTLCGYFIPKDAHIIPNLWGIHMDPKLWDDPEAFNPGRFIVDGKVVKPPYFMPFSVGRRMCVGDILSRIETFYFLSTILQKFDLRTPENEPPPSLEGISHISLKPAPYKVCAIPRRESSDS